MAYCLVTPVSISSRLTPSLPPRLDHAACHTYSEVDYHMSVVNAVESVIILCRGNELMNSFSEVTFYKEPFYMNRIYRCFTKFFIIQ